MSHVCHWRHAYWFDNALRRLFHNPERLCGPYVQPGATVLDVGCGMGFFSIGLTCLVGPGGRVLSVDLQPEMIEVLMRRARRRGVAGCIEPHVCTADSLGIEAAVDFALAFWMVHEVPDQARLARQVRACLKPGGKFLVVEPKIHVSRTALEQTIRDIKSAGFRLIGQPPVRLSRAALFEAVVTP